MSSEDLSAERERYVRIVESLAFPDPSSLVVEVASDDPGRQSPRQLLPDWARAVEQARGNPEQAWNLYLHVPYCKSICTFCNYKRLRVSSKKALDEYVDFMVEEMALFAPALKGAEFNALYVGGGTPSVLDAAQLDRLLSALHDHYAFLPDAQKNFEYDPAVMSPDRLEVIRRFDFTRYSFGIQSVDVDINVLHNRGRQGPSHLERQFGMLLREDAPYAVNVDFLLGLDGTTPERMLTEIEETLTRHRPDEVSIYMISPTAEYVEKHFGGDPARYREFLRAFEERVPDALAGVAERADYRITASGKHLLKLIRKESRKAKRGSLNSYCDIPTQIHRPLNLLGFGDSARSRIHGVMSYRAEHDTDDRSADSPRYIVRRRALADEVFGYVALVLRDGDRLSRSKFRRVFGRDLLELCREPVDKLLTLGVATLTDDELALAPQPRHERLRDILFFLPKDRLARIREAHGSSRPSASSPGPAVDAIAVEAAVRPLQVGAPLPAGWTLQAITAAGLTIEHPTGDLVLVKLLSPAGTHPSFASTRDFDIQYHVRAGTPGGPHLEAPLLALIEALRANER